MKTSTWQVRMECHAWPSTSSGKEARALAREMRVTSLPPTSTLYDEAMLARETLVGDVCEVDTSFADLVLEDAADDAVTEALAVAIR